MQSSIISNIKFSLVWLTIVTDYKMLIYYYFSRYYIFKIVISLNLLLIILLSKIVPLLIQLFFVWI